MARGIFFFIKLAIVVAVAVWLANNPGSVSFDWLGYRIDTSMALLLLGLVILAVLVVLLYRLGRALAATPAKVGAGFRQRRERRGYQALAQGLVAGQLGDKERARLQARRAGDRLEAQPMLQLLQAQAAQMAGEEEEARACFKEMLQAEETRLLGLRGLAMLSLQDGKEEQAREYLERARAIEPKLPWVLDNLFELSQKAGDLPYAESILRESQRQGALPREDALRKRAIVMYQRAEAELAEGKKVEAENRARAASRLEPALLAPVFLQVRLLAERGRKRKAAGLLQEAWRREPHPDIGEAWLALDANASPLDQVRRVATLVRGRDNHRESHLLQARVALEAELWGEARRHLAPLLEETPPEQRTCYLMAKIEEGEKGEGAGSEWLHRAASAVPAPMWLCERCGAISEHWTAHCRACGSFDSLNWRTPPHLAPSVPRTIEAETVDTNLLEVEPSSSKGDSDAA